MTTASRKIQVAIGSGLYPVGDLIFETDGRRQSSAFIYSEDWVNRPGAFPIAPSMPLTTVPQFSSGARGSMRSALPGAISDATPDSWGRGIITKALGRPGTELEYLLAASDETRQGALRFIDESGEPVSSSNPPIPRQNTLASVQTLANLMESNGDPALIKQKANEAIGYVGSLGGARPKSDFDDNGTLAIAKFTSERDTMAIERMEVATLTLAKDVGLRAAEARILDRTARYPVAIIKRFDRNGDKRRHYISAQTFLDVPEASGSSYTELSDSMREHAGTEEQVETELGELYSRIVFSILVSNNDDHLKNTGFVYAGNGAWVLSPAFDINPQPQRHRSLETAIMEGEPADASIDLAISAAPFFELSEDRGRKIAGKIAHTINEKWATHARNAGMISDEIATYAPAFQNEEMKKALRIGGPPTVVHSKDNEPE